MNAGTSVPPLTARTVREVDAAGAGAIDFTALIAEGEPLIIRGLVRHWPLVAAGLRSPADAAEYLLSFYGGRPVAGSTLPASEGGRYFYDDSLARMNFDREYVRLDAYLARMTERLGDPDAPSLYVGSTDLDGYLPGFTLQNDLDLPGSAFDRVLKSIWIGNRTVAPTHYDMSNNIACVAVGERRFTLFPPDQITNLYPGPLEPTPGGQVVSLVDLRAPDFDRFPDFARALDHARVAHLRTGDAVVYPALWWHNVEALSDFNMMVNYWWDGVPAFMDSPMTTILHGMLSLRDRPMAEKRALRALFDYYLFGPTARPIAHLPEGARGELAPLDDHSARRLRAKLLQRMNR